MKKLVLATVADKKITDEDIDYIINQYPVLEREHMNTEQGRAKILDQLISCEVMYEFAKEESIYEMEEFKEQLKEAEKDILTQMGIVKAKGIVNISENDTLEYYINNIEKFEVKDMVSARHILVETEEEAFKVKREIENKEISFSDAALRYSMCPSNINGGSLGTFERGKMVIPFEEVAFKAEINILTDPVETEFGFHLILVEDFKEGYKKEFDDVKEEIRITLKKKGELKNYKDKLKELKEKYYIK